MVEQRTSLWILLLNLSSKEDLCLIERFFFLKICDQCNNDFFFVPLHLHITSYYKTRIPPKKRLLFFLFSVQPHCSSPLFGLQPPLMQGKRIKDVTNIKTKNQANIAQKTINTQVATQLLLLLATRYLPSRVEVKELQELQSMSKKTRPLSFQVYAASRRRGPSSCYTVHHRPGNIQSFSPPSSFLTIKPPSLSYQ